MCRRCLQKTALLQQCTHLGGAPAKTYIADGRVERVARGEYVLAQALGHAPVVRSIRFQERAEPVRREHIRPEVAVVTCRIVVAGKDVLEMRHTVSHHEL